MARRTRAGPAAFRFDRQSPISDRLHDAPGVQIVQAEDRTIGQTRSGEEPTKLRPTSMLILLVTSQRSTLIDRSSSLSLFA